MLSQVTHHSAILPSSMRNTAPKSNCALRPEGGNGPIGPCCVPSYVVQAATRSPSASRSFIVCTESGNTAVSSCRNCLIWAIPRLEIRCRFAMTHDIRCHECIENFRLTAVPGVDEPPDHSFVL